MLYLCIHIPDAVEPIERGERFEDPLFDALEAEGIEAEWLGGGTALETVDGRMTITGCDIEFEVADIALALPVIRRVLTEAEAPPDTTIRQCEPEVVIHRLSEEV